jgi:hypothetical protein
MWAVILYMVGIIATIGALFLFLARLVSFFMTRAWLDELVDFDEFPLELGAAFFALIVLFVAAMADRDNFLNPGLLEYAAGVAALINLSIIGLFLAIFAIFVVVAFIWFLIALPLEIFRSDQGTARRARSERHPHHRRVLHLGWCRFRATRHCDRQIRHVGSRVACKRRLDRPLIRPAADRDAGCGRHRHHSPSKCSFGDDRAGGTTSARAGTLER